MKNEVIGYLKRLHESECRLQDIPGMGNREPERRKMYLEWAIRKLEGKLSAEMDNVIVMNTAPTGIGNMSGKEEFQCTISFSMSGMFSEQLQAETYFKSRMFDTVVGAMTNETDNL